MRWVGHLACVEENGNVYGVLIGKRKERGHMKEEAYVRQYHTFIS